MNTISFINKATLIYGNFFDYSKVDYLNTNTKVCIICPIHGEFWQTPKYFLKGNGCPLCNNNKKGKPKKTTEQFIKEAIVIHGEKYDYSKSVYTGNHEKVLITCRQHGDFWQEAISHLKGMGCPKCGILNSINKQQKTNQEFLEECQKKWGNRYSYDKTVYKGALKKVTITCPLHGDFSIMASDFLSGHGCQECGGVKRQNTETFITRSKLIHGESYDYSEVKYINNKTKVCIICPTHGEFWQTPSRHLSGDKCPYCFKSIKKTTEQFIKEANEKHGNKYDYSKTIYNGNKKYVIITCPFHGDFKQKPLSHLQGQGCPKCNISHLEQIIENALVFNNIKFVYQQKFSWLGGKSLDFYIPNANIAIECQGIQHFKPIGFFGGQAKFDKQQIRDIEKFNECKKHNIKLFYFSDKNYLCNNDIYNNSPVLNSVEELIKIINEILTKNNEKIRLIVTF